VLRFAIAVSDRTAVCGNFFGSQMAGIRLLVQEVFVKNLQMNGTGNQGNCHQNKKRNDQ
jgi:hypothetical protein